LDKAHALNVLQAMLAEVELWLRNATRTSSGKTINKLSVNGIMHNLDSTLTDLNKKRKNAKPDISAEVVQHCLRCALTDGIQRQDPLIVSFAQSAWSVLISHISLMNANLEHSVMWLDWRNAKTVHQARDVQVEATEARLLIALSRHTRRSLDGQSV
jgi:hypothetical protein